MANIPGAYEIFNDIFKRYQSIYFISDTHFGDKDLREAFPSRPSDEEFVKLINSKVGKTDLLIHLGDCGDPSYLAKIKADVWLVMGNHDKGKTNYLQNTQSFCYSQAQYSWEEALTEVEKLCPNCTYAIMEEYRFRSPFEVWKIYANNCLAKKVFEGPVQIGEKLILSHEPLDCNWAFNIHGHVHNPHHKNDIRHLNVCADAIQYTPINLSQWLKTAPLKPIQSIHRITINNAVERCTQK